MRNRAGRYELQYEVTMLDGPLQGVTRWLSQEDFETLWESAHDDAEAPTSMAHTANGEPPELVVVRRTRSRVRRSVNSAEDGVFDALGRELVCGRAREEMVIPAR